MSYSIYQLKEKSIPMPIPSTARKIAESAAKEQSTPSKKRQVYLNTLAVCVVNNYLRMMGIPTNLKASDSWNPVVRTFSDVSDLKLAELGHMECRPISPVSLNEPITVLFDFPKDMPDNRIGCMVVEFDEVQGKASLLGFAKKVSSGESLSIVQLFHMDDFGEYFEELSNERIEQPKKSVNLRQWLQDVFEPDWQVVKILLNTNLDNLVSIRSIPSGALSPNKERGKLIELGCQPIVQSVVLAVELIQPKTESEIDLKVEVHSRGLQPYLPPQLYISILDADKVEVMGANARGKNRSIKFEFKCEPGERFSVKLALGHVNVIEDFVI